MYCKRMEKYIRHPNTKCVSCGKEIYKRLCEITKNNGNVFCSVVCHAKFRTRPLTCVICGNEYSRHFHRKTCSRACANKNRTGTKYKLNRPKDKVVYMDGLKVRLLIERGSKCERCGFSKTEILIVHHKDRDRMHNDLSNLELICPNCHAEEHYMEKSWLKRYNVEEYKEKLLLHEPFALYLSSERSPSGFMAEVLKTSR